MTNMQSLALVCRSAFGCIANAHWTLQAAPNSTGTQDGKDNTLVMHDAGPAAGLIDGKSMLVVQAILPDLARSSVVQLHMQQPKPYAIGMDANCSS